MTFQTTPISLMYLLAGVINLFTAIINWRHRHGRGGIATLSLVFFATGLWLIGNFMELSVNEPENKQFFMMVEDSIGGISYILLLLFVMDYFKLAPWFKGRWRTSLWIVGFANILIGWTNSIHHWFWTGYKPGPPGSNVIYYLHGPLWLAANLFFMGLIFFSLGLAIYKTFISRGPERQIALFMTVAMAAPFITYLLFLLLPDQFTGLLAIPFGYSITALLIDWAVVEDFRLDINQKTEDLKFSVEELRQQIAKREELEHELLQSQEFLSMRLAIQSAKLTGVYDLILISGQASSHDELIQTSLTKITAVLACQMTVFFNLERGQELRLEAWHGTGFTPFDMTKPIPSDWLPISLGVRAELSSRNSADLPPELRQKDYDSALFKWVIVQNRPLGILAAYWPLGYQFSVEEISLFSALSDGLGLIVENARLRQVGADEATVQERRRLARDLHDSVTQSLHSLVLSSETALAETQNSDRLKRILNRLDTGARQALKEMRLLLYELRLATLDDINLVELIANRFEAVEHRAGILTDLIIEPTVSWPNQLEKELYPLTMEALNNSIKHARATNVAIRFSGSHENMQMEIQDNGQGFDPRTVQPGGMGLKNMAERCQRLGSELEIISSPSAGTTIRVKIKNQYEHSSLKFVKETIHE